MDNAPGVLSRESVAALLKEFGSVQVQTEKNLCWFLHSPVMGSLNQMDRTELRAALLIQTLGQLAARKPSAGPQESHPIADYPEAGQQAFETAQQTRKGWSAYLCLRRAWQALVISGRA